MASGAEQEQDTPFDAEDLHVDEVIDSNLASEVPDDDRFSSGVPDGQRANPLDFIQMTGLTRAPVREKAAPIVPEGVQDDDLNPTAPLSFYEQGVKDVDESSPTGTTGMDDSVLDQRIGPDHSSDTLHSAPAPRSADIFKDIVAGLEKQSGSPDLQTGTPADETPLEERSASSDLLALLNVLEDSAQSTPSDDASDSFDDFIDEGNASDAAAIPATAATDETTDDWDAMLDAATPASESDSLFEAPVTTPKATPNSGALAEAEQLMQALGRKADRPPVPTEVMVPVDAVQAPAVEVANDSLLPTYTPTAPPAADLNADLAYDYSANPSRRRSRRHSRAARAGKRIIRGGLVAAVLIGGAAAGYIYVVLPMLTQAEDQEVRADRMMAEARYREASKAYKSLAASYQNDPVRGPEALFRAAYALTLGSSRSHDEMSARYNEALALFDTFVNEYPAHQKKTRALAIMGRLHYELRDYEQAITILRDQADPARDPAAAVSILRYLGRSYSQLADYEAAKNAYVLAATYPGNYTKDEDFYALGDMFRTRAGLATDEADRADYLQSAADYLGRAAQVPGLDPGRKATIREELQLLEFRGDNPEMDETGADATTTPADMPEMDVTLSEPPETVDTPEAALPPVDGGHEVDPGAELHTVLPAPEMAESNPAPTEEEPAEETDPVPSEQATE